MTTLYQCEVCEKINNYRNTVTAFKTGVNTTLQLRAHIDVCDACWNKLFGKYIVKADDCVHEYKKTDNGKGVFVCLKCSKILSIEVEEDEK